MPSDVIEDEPLPTKKRVTCYVDEEKLNASAKLMSPSEMLDMAMETVLQENNEDFQHVLRVTKLNSILAEAAEQMKIIEAQRAVIAEKINITTEMLNREEEQWKKIKTTVVLRQWVGILNKIIIVNQYHIEPIERESKDIVDLIRSVNPHFDLRIHISALKEEMA